MSEDVADLFRQVASNMSRVADSGYVGAVGRAADLLHGVHEPAVPVRVP